MSQIRFDPFAAPAILLAATAAGCVIPLAPEFESPEANVPPYVFDSLPAEGEIITASQSDEVPEITVWLADPNRGDNLHLRWIFDYPKYDDTFTRLVERENPVPPPEDGGIVRGPIRFAPSCFLHNIARGLTQHTLMLAVADRPFVPPAEVDPPDYRLDKVSEGGYRIRAVWIIRNLECR